MINLTYAQIDKKTGEVLNLVEFSNNLNLPKEYEWQLVNEQRVLIGCFYIDGKFFETDKITEILKDETIRDKIENLKVNVEHNSADNMKSMLAITDLAKTSSDKSTMIEQAIVDLANSSSKKYKLLEKAIEDLTKLITGGRK